MMLIDVLISMAILTGFGVIVFEILDDASTGKITKPQAGFFTLVFSIFAVVALLIVLA